jgi:hypothetical protein
MESTNATPARNEAPRFCPDNNRKESSRSAMLPASRWPWIEAMISGTGASA